MQHDESTPPWGPANPHPLSRLKTELVWEGKYDETGQPRLSRLPAPPLQLECSERIDGPAATTAGGSEPNLLVWADNRLAMAALLERYRRGVDLIYIDPPFDAGTSVGLQVPLGHEGAVDAVAYRDRWGTGIDSYLHTLYERLVLAKELLAERGNLFVHVDYRANSPVRLLLDEVFGPQLVNEIIWHYNSGPRAQNAFGKRHDTLFRYSLDAATAFMASESSAAREPYSPDINVPAAKAHYYHPLGKVKGDVWRINILGQNDRLERTGLYTQKPEALLEQIVAVCCPENGLVADFYCGSGTTLAVAEKLGRRWIGVDLGRHAVHICRKRLTGVQRALHAAGRPYRPFDICTLGRGERHFWQTTRLATGPASSDDDYRRAVLHAYGAEPLPTPPLRPSEPEPGARHSMGSRATSGGSGRLEGILPATDCRECLAPTILHGRKGDALVCVGAVDACLAEADLLAAARAAGAARSRELHCLAWEMECDLARHKQVVEGQTGVAIRLKLIPREIMEPNRGVCRFLEAGSVQARVLEQDGRVDVEIVDVTPALPDEAEAGSAALRERAHRQAFDFVDYWAVDFDYQPGQPFRPHWQAFRTRRERRLATRSAARRTYTTPGPHHIAVQVIDVFGVETRTLISVEE